MPHPVYRAKKAGGNTSSSEEGFQTWNRGSRNTVDRKARDGGEFWAFGSPYEEDNQYGFDQPLANTEFPENGEKWEMKAVPDAPEPNRDSPNPSKWDDFNGLGRGETKSSKDPHPGGGW